MSLIQRLSIQDRHSFPHTDLIFRIRLLRVVDFTTTVMIFGCCSGGCEVVFALSRGRGHSVLEDWCDVSYVVVFVSRILAAAAHSSRSAKRFAAAVIERTMLPLSNLP